ncbi:MAG TPA: DUF29 domain-containing protein [Candidatus Binataceae bacterium]|nr:DUF29 domain-containing protein [Candidatus Binataceae bacterium]
MASLKRACNSLYDHDYYGWLKAQIHALRERRLEEIDFENVAEEIEDLGKSERRSLESHLETLLSHLLKLSYATELSRNRNTRAWQNTIELARFRIRRLLGESPSLRPELDEIFRNAYQGARISARRALGFPAEPLPEIPPWTLDQALDETFIPESAC